MNLYPDSGKKLKKAVKVLNFVGYLLSSVAGISLGLAVGTWLFRAGGNGWLCSAVSVLAGSLAATLPILMVWVCGLILWNISDASENSQALRQRLDA